MANGYGRWNPSTIALQPSDLSHLLSQVDHERGAPVQAARFLAAVVVLRPLFAVTDRSHPIRGYAAADEVVLDGVGATITEREVVLCRADAAGVAFDLDTQRRVLPHR